MNKNYFAHLLLLILIFNSCNQRSNSYFEKELTFPEIVTPDQKVKLASYVVPTENQYKWQRLELTILIDFDTDTFIEDTDADDDKDSNMFCPADFDAEQLVATLQEAGYNMIVLSAKRRDGFCLWPTNSSKYSVAFSEWQKGEGDLVQELKQACDKHNMQFGIYLCSGELQNEKIESPLQLNKLFLMQLKELLSNYGKIDAIWIDDKACTIQECDPARYYHIKDSLQPSAIIAVVDKDMRRVNRESEIGRESKWSLTASQPDINKPAIKENSRSNNSTNSENPGSREAIGRAKHICWCPSELDISIRPDRHYREEEESRIKTVAELVEIYYRSVGLNSLLQIRVSLNRLGQLDEMDEANLKMFGRYINTVFNNNVLRQSEVEWKAAAGASREFTVLPGETINTIMLQENIRKGQRVEEFTLKGLLDDEWVMLAEGTTIGYKRLIKVESCKPTKIKLTVDKTRDIANIQNIGAYFAPPIEEGPDE